ncbi:hypothetical protein MA16_Dca026472 [Dendrobium catenatum]|uniref:Uncharacterized protein n=1 Tax=Dendrobium catenatum TaxID=906689 RepID=A0A2I0VI25_9ASPA|nr:hypothetical protein MA16_Dca026472 [Dendrobium catenatum]
MVLGLPCLGSLVPTAASLVSCGWLLDFRALAPWCPQLAVSVPWLLGFHGWLLVFRAGWFSRSLVPRFCAGLFGFCGCLLGFLAGLFPVTVWGLFCGFGALFLELIAGF